MKSEPTRGDAQGSRTEHPVKRAVLYLRVSSPSQVDTDYDPEGNSIPSQRTACTEKAAELGAEIVAEYVEPGRSATNVEGRPQFREMMARIKNETDVDYVIVYARSRMHRDGIDAAITKRDLRASGVALVSVMDFTEDTYVGDLVAHVIDGVNEYQSRASGADIAYKMAAKAQRGGTNGIAKLGYVNVRERFDGRTVRTIAVDPDRAGYVTMMFELYATGRYSFPSLRETITKAGLRTKPRKTHPAGCAISISKIGALLRDRYYLGEVIYKGQVYPGRHEPLVGQDLFDRVQHVLDVQRSGGTRERRYHHHLKGIVWCQRCGKRLILTVPRSSSGRKYFYFVCRGRQMRTCDLPHIPLGQVEHAVEQHLATFAISPSGAETLRQELNHAIASGQASATALRRKLNTECKRLRSLEDQLLNLVGHSDWPQDKLTAKLRDLAIRKADIRSQLTDVDITEHINDHTTITTLLDLLTDPQTLFRRCTDEAKTIFMKASYTKITIDIDEHANGSQ